MYKKIHNLGFSNNYGTIYRHIEFKNPIQTLVQSMTNCLLSDNRYNS